MQPQSPRVNRHVAAFVVALLCLLVSNAPAAETPNFILILIDDMGWNGTPLRMDPAVSNSAMPVLEMPRLAAFARESIRFRNAYAGAPQCAPSRVCIQTGMCAPHSGFTVYLGGENSYPEPDTRPPLDLRRENVLMPVLPCIADMNLDRHETTIAEALAPLGYTSAHFGKWHMRGNGPADHGYAEHDGETDNKQGSQRIEGDPKLMVSVTERSVDFLRRQVEAKHPFYLQVSHYAVHAGYECFPETEKKYAEHPAVLAAFAGIENENQRARAIANVARWLAMANDLDTAIGTLLDEVDRLGIADNTYVVVVADNGYRHSAVWDAVSDDEYPLRGAKWWIWDGGLRVPMWVRGPGIAAGSASDANVVHYDLLPTFVDLAGGQAGQLVDVDGKSLRPLFDRSLVDMSAIRDAALPDEFRDRALYFHYPHYRSSVPGSAIVAGRWKVVHLYEQPDVPLLFDLEEDLGETRSVAGDYPEVFGRLHGQLFDYLTQVDARIPQPNPNFNAAKLAEWYEADADRMKQRQGKDEWRWPGSGASASE